MNCVLARLCNDFSFFFKYQAINVDIIIHGYQNLKLGYTVMISLYNSLVIITYRLIHIPSILQHDSGVSLLIVLGVQYYTNAYLISMGEVTKKIHYTATV